MTTPTLTTNARKCASFSKKKNATQANMAPKKSTERPHYKQHRTKKPTEFYSPSPTMHQQNLAIKNVILKNLKILHNDPETKPLFSLPPLISFERDKNFGNILIRSAFSSDNQPGTFKCKRTRCTTSYFVSNTVKISRPNRSAEGTNHFICISVNVIYLSLIHI